MRCDLGGVLRSLDEYHVRARLRVPVGPLDRRVQSQRRARVGAGHDEQIVVGPGVQGGRQRLFEHRRIDDLFVRQMAASLGENLVLQLNRGNPGRVVGPDGAHHVHRRAVSGIGIGDERHVAQRADDHPGSFGHFARGGQADVGQPEPGRGHAGTGHIRRDVTGPFGQLRRDSIENPWRDDQFALVQ